MKAVEIISAEVLPKFEKLEPYHSSLSSDWFGQSFSPPAHYLFGMDRDHLHFFASRNSHAVIHPESRPGEFQAELWKYDVAEFFLRAPDSNHYLEFNLAPNGGWWSCLFKETLVPVEENNPPLPGVIASGEVAPDSWNAHAKIPLSFLREHLDFSPEWSDVFGSEDHDGAIWIGIVNSADRRNAEAGFVDRIRRGNGDISSVNLRERLI